MTDCLKPVSVELDPLFIKALKIMQSTKPSAADELLEMYHEICQQKKGDIKTDSDDAGHLKKKLQKKDIYDTRKEIGDKGAEKTNDLQSGSRQPSELDSSSNDEDDLIANKLNMSTELKNAKKRKLSSDSDTEISDSEAMEDDLQIDLDISSLSCVVCKTLSQVNTNRLVECQECHNLYHQECHKPPITENVNDPRFVWYCVKCAKNMKKIVTASKVMTKKPKVSTSPLPGVSGGSTATSRNSPTPFTKAATIEMKQNAASLSAHSLSMIQQPFKRFDLSLKPLVPKENGSAGNRNATTSGVTKDAPSKSKQVPEQSKASLSKPGKSASSSKDGGSNKVVSKYSSSFTSAIGASASDSITRLGGEIAKKTTTIQKLGDKK